MVLVFLNWAYLFFTAFLLGFSFSKFVGKLFGYKIKNIGETVFYGIIMASAYAQVYSLFGAVGGMADLIMLCLCLVILAVWGGEIRELARRLLRAGAGRKAVFLLLALLWGYCTSRGYMHYDSDLYHAQSIRWIEEQGIAFGLGNIHVRFAYNSSLFALSALYSMRFLAGQSLHAVNGFLALLLSLEAVRVFGCHKAQKPPGKLFGCADFARLGAFYYLTVIYRDIVAPASDYAIMCVVFYIVIRWLSYLDQQEADTAPYALLCVAGVYAVTLKLTAGLILLLAVKPGYQLIRERRYRDTAVYIALGAAVLAPWMIRTAVISGYLLYPFPALDVLDVDWKISAEAAANDAAEIKTWGRGLNDASLVNMPIKEWFPQWFSTMLPTSGKLFVVADLVCAAFAAVWALAGLFLHLAGKRRQGGFSFDNLLVLAAVLASYGFWQVSAPLLRYGYAYVLLVPLLTAGIIYNSLRLPGAAEYALFLAVCLFAAGKAFSFAGYAWSMSRQPYYVRQQDYGRYELDSFEAGGVQFYYPESGDRVGYWDFPAVPRIVEIEPRGRQIRAGFREKQ